MQAIVLSGIAGSGKTTFYVRRFLHTHVRLSLDLLGDRKRENVLMHACLAAQQPFVVDNTNLLASARRRYGQLARDSGFKTALYFFDTSTREAVARNEGREGKHRVPKVAIFAGQKKLERPTVSEPFDEIQVVRIDANGEFLVTPLDG